jgi:hypothetical protein
MDGLARAEDELSRGKDGLSQNEDELGRGVDYRKLKDQHKESIFLSPVKIFQYILVSHFVTLKNSPGNERRLHFMSIV